MKENFAENRIQEQYEKSALKQQRETVPEHLIRQARHGDRNALIQLCGEIKGRILYSSKRFLQNDQDAEDVAQEALIRVCENIRKLKEPKTFQKWVSTITMNEVRRQVKKNMAMSGNIMYMDDCIEALSIEEENEDFLPVAYTFREEECRMLTGFVDALPQRQREAIVLHYFDGLNVTETAEVMGIPQTKASFYLKLAREKIKKMLLAQPGQAGGTDYAALAAAPIGPALTQAMNRESLHLLDTKQGFMKKAMAACERYIAGQPQSLAGMSAGLSVGVIACICAGILGAAAVLPEVVSKKGASAEVPDGTASGDLPVAETRIAFSGGDPSYAHLNPQKAACEISGLSVSGWTITAAEGGEALFSGSGGSADIPVSSLGNGAYRVTFTAADQNGAEYRLYNNFHILHNTDGA